jgi:L-arabinokinase
MSAGCFDRGAHILIDSKFPEGKGVSSSAALEVAVMQGVGGSVRHSDRAREMALLCQKVENWWWASCGVMDQMSAVCGEQNRLLALLCQPGGAVRAWWSCRPKFRCGALIPVYGIP